MRLLTISDVCGVAALAVLAAAGPAAADSYDGNWTGSIASYSNLGAIACRATVWAKAEKNRVMGMVQSGTALWHLSGTIAPSGMFSGKIDQFALAGKFTVTSFVGSFVGQRECGLQQLFMSREEIAR